MAKIPKYLAFKQDEEQNNVLSGLINRIASVRDFAQSKLEERRATFQQEGMQPLERGEQGALSTGFVAVEQGAGLLNDLIGNAIKDAIAKIPAGTTGFNFGEQLKAAGEIIGENVNLAAQNIPTIGGGNFAESFENNIAKPLGKWLAKNPEARRHIQGAGEVLQLYGTIKMGEALVKAAFPKKTPKTSQAPAPTSTQIPVDEQMRQFVKHPDQFQLYRGTNPANKTGTSFTNIREWAGKFGPVGDPITLPANAKVHFLTEADALNALKRGIISEKEIISRFFDRGFDAVVKYDTLNPSVMEVVVSPKLFQEVGGRTAGQFIGGQLLAGKSAAVTQATQMAQAGSTKKQIFDFLSTKIKEGVISEDEMAEIIGNLTD